MEKLLAAFDFTHGQWQDIRTLLLWMKSNKKSIDDLAKSIQAQTAKRKYKNKKPVFKGIQCPSCKKEMRLYPANSHKGDQVGGNYKSQWYCPACSASIFNDASVLEEIERLKKLGSFDHVNRKKLT